MDKLQGERDKLQAENQSLMAQLVDALEEYAKDTAESDAGWGAKVAKAKEERDALKARLESEKEAWKQKLLCYTRDTVDCTCLRASVHR